jgi:hypothetical protein
MKAYLIDPRTRQICAIELIKGDKLMLAEMLELIGAPTGLDHQMISDMKDSIWVDEFGLKRGQRIYAFKLPIQSDPYAGKAIIIGADEAGRTKAPFIPIEVLRADIEWLGEILPQVLWEETPTGERAVVTYSRLVEK